LCGALGGVMILLAFQRLWRSCWIAMLGAAPAVLVGGFQVLLRRRNGMLADQDAYFAPGFPSDRTFGGYLKWFPHMWNSFVLTPVGWRFGLLVVVLAVAGLISMWVRGRKVWAVAFAGMFLAALAGAIVRGLPIAERVALYLVPPLMILVASGLDGLVRGLHRLLAQRSGAKAGLALGAGALAVLVGLAAQPAFAGSVNELVDPLVVAPYQHTHGDKELDNGRALMREIKGRLRPGDVVLSYWYTEPLMAWYGGQYGIPVAGYVNVTSPAQCNPDGLPTLVAGAKRVYYVHLEMLSYHPTDLHARVVAELAKRGKVVDSHVYGSGSISDDTASWTLVDLGAGPDTRFPPPPPLDPSVGCVTYDSQWR